jgi:hypothetical protein
MRRVFVLFWGCLRKCNSTYNLIQFANLTAVKQKGNSTLELSLCDCRTSSKTTGPLSKKEQLDTASFADGCFILNKLYWDLCK